jgi:Ribosome inactivating protein
MPNLRLDSYPQDMKALTLQVTDPSTAPGGHRVQRAASTAMVDVDVIASAAAQVTMLVKESGLYCKGFRNGHGTFYFKDENGGANELRFGCSYVGSNSIGIFVDPDSAVTKKQRAKRDIVESVATLAAFNGGNDLHLKEHLATMVFCVSEAIRFTIVYDRIVETCTGAGATFSFRDLRAYVQNWGALSSGERVDGTTPNKVFTSHG